MNKKKRNRVFPIEEKLAAVEWNLKLLKTSAEITHTPLRTLKSMIQVSVMAPAQSFLQEIVNSHSAKRRTLASGGKRAQSSHKNWVILLPIPPPARAKSKYIFWLH